MDAHLLAYLTDRYEIVASCNCKDQWGTDGYTLWGGYYNQAFYPSRLNSFMPAQTKAQQIPVPVFRMLGSDPIYQYDLDMLDENAIQEVVTLEPVYAGAGEGSGGRGGGGNPYWVQWFFDLNFRAPALSFGYTQVGQENSFGWPRIKDGLIDQIGLLQTWQERGELIVETLADSGTWFKAEHEVTPASAITALHYWKEEGRKSIWYCSRFYRLNLFWEDQQAYIRDFHIFDERYAERYLHEPCRTADSIYDTLPVMDGARWSNSLIKAGIWPMVRSSDGELVPLRCQEDSLEVTEVSQDELLMVAEIIEGGTLRINCSQNSVTIMADQCDWGLQMIWSDRKQEPHMIAASDEIGYEYNGYHYTVHCKKGDVGELSKGAGSIWIQPESGVIQFCLI
ncbi:hypothetical protein [Paenibacillus herberti]|uniref:Uncharacterized protein n=1 Tax=Paenibacillus herberti TaxID=1619309 RepID=A0A229P3S1_9BACL|nr:hypothetical protein [Paenibacillus herberti]OXM16727.1 hypothetical protein CGZ75_08730 [Paenibacillus herberti]